jgi:hypothetical protein
MAGPRTFKQLVQAVIWYQETYKAGGITFGNGQIAIALLLYNWLHPAL